MEAKIFVLGGLLCKELEIDILPKGAQRSHPAAADVFIRCTICKEYIAMSSNNYRAQEVFICDKCKAAILHIRKILEDRGSIT